MPEDDVDEVDELDELDDLDELDEEKDEVLLGVNEDAPPVELDDVDPPVDRVDDELPVTLVDDGVPSELAEDDDALLLTLIVDDDPTVVGLVDDEPPVAVMLVADEVGGRLVDDDGTLELVGDVLPGNPPPVLVDVPGEELLQATAMLPVHAPANRKENLSRREITIDHHLA